MRRTGVERAEQPQADLLPVVLLRSRRQRLPLCDAGAVIWRICLVLHSGNGDVLKTASVSCRR